MKIFKSLLLIFCSISLSCNNVSESSILNEVDASSGKVYLKSSLISDESIPDNAKEFIKDFFSKEDMGDFSGALEDVNMAIELVPNKDLLFFLRGLIYWRLNDFLSSVENYNIALDLGSDNRIYNFRALSKFQLEDYYGSIADWTKALEFDKKNAYYHRRGNAKLKLGDYKGAIGDYGKSIELDPNYSSAYSNRAIAKVKMEDYNGAITDFDQAIELDPNNSRAYNARGKLKHMIGDIKGGCEDWQKVRYIGSTNIDNTLRLIDKYCNEHY